MKVLVIDVGGTNIKVFASGEAETRKFPSGPDLTPKQMVGGVVQAAAGWDYEAVSVGYPGTVLHGRPLIDPVNLAPGGSASTSRPRSGAPSRSSTTPPCRPWGVTKGESCSFSDWGPASARP